MSVSQDVRFAIRLLVKDRWFTAAAAVALALGSRCHRRIVLGVTIVAT
jgi:hypothetical protein